MATQLGLYNEALRLLGERRLASLSENREPRRVLDDIWNDGAMKYCLEQGQWDFAMRAVKITKSVTVPAFGFTYAFDKPNDFIRTAGLSADEAFNMPLLYTLEEVGFWFANVNPIYVRYVSNDTNYGSDLTRWPQTFSKYVAAYLASEAAWTLTQDEKKRNDAILLATSRLLDARSKNALANATSFAPQGAWAASRLKNGSRRDRGNRSSLIG